MNGRIEWTGANMPMVGEIAERFARERPFADRTIGVSIHLEPKTAVLLRALHAGGATVVATGNLGTTQADVVEALNAEGIEAFGDASDDRHTHASNVARVMETGPDILLDNGADLCALAGGLDIVGGTEETTSGANRLRGELAGRVAFPVIVINDSPLKAIVENKHGVGQSVAESFLRITNLMPQGKRVVVVGYGWCGRGIAHYFRSLGSEVSVVERDEIKALEAAVDGFAVGSLDDLAPKGSVFITATGARHVLTTDHVAAMPDGAVLANAGHFDDEIDVEGLRTVAGVTELDHGIERFALHEGPSVFLLTGGRMVNLGGRAPKGNSIETMDLGFTLQALSLERVALASETLDVGPQPVPDDIDRVAAAAMTSRLMAARRR